jgi:membrane-associated phospholipid phosphatase
MTRRWRLLLVLWLAAIAISLCLDGVVTRFLFERHFHVESAGIMRGTLWAHILKMFGDYRTTCVVVLLLVVAARLPWRKAALVLVCSAVSVTAEIAKLIVGRARPVTEDLLLVPTFEFNMFSKPAGGASFPSGHAVLAFATATCLARYYPRWAALAYSAAALVAVERVLELAHHLSDVVASAGIAVLVTGWCIRLLEPYFIGHPQPNLREEEIAV